MLPPSPPSPPLGPPRGTNFSRRKAIQPCPPSPALTVIFASSMNMPAVRVVDADVAAALAVGGLFYRLDANEAACSAFVFILNDTGDLRKQRVVPADP